MNGYYLDINIFSSMCFITLLGCQKAILIKGKIILD